jgi:hypothetical protein
MFKPLYAIFLFTSDQDIVKQDIAMRIGTFVGGGDLKLQAHAHIRHLLSSHLS